MKQMAMIMSLRTRVGFFCSECLCVCVCVCVWVGVWMWVGVGGCAFEYDCRTHITLLFALHQTKQICVCISHFMTCIN